MTWARELWGVTLVLSCTIGVASAGGCSGDIGPVRDEGDASAGSSGASGSGGSGGSTGGAAGRGGASGTSGSGGTAAGSAGRATGGASGAAGTGGSIPPGCGPRSDETRCFQCARTNCCVELNACGRAPVCSSGGDEFGCILRCVRDRVADGGLADDPTIAGCATNCAQVGVVVAEETSDLIGCLNKGVRADGGSGADCFVECFSGD